MQLEMHVLGAGDGVAGGTVGTQLLAGADPAPVRRRVAVEVQVPVVIAVVTAEDPPQAGAGSRPHHPPRPGGDGPHGDAPWTHDVGPPVRTTAGAGEPPRVDEGAGLVEGADHAARAARSRRGGGGTGASCRRLTRRAGGSPGS